MRQAEELDHLVGGLAEAGIGRAEQTRKHRALMLLAGEDQVVANRELRKHLQQLKGAADAQAVDIAGTHAGGDPAVNPDLAVVRPQLAEHAIEQRGFSRAVRPDDAEDFTFAGRRTTRRRPR